MSRPTVRALTLLELLQSRSQISGAELARRVGVDRRTLRRYIATLEEIGIPISADYGPHGGYRVMPGFKLPPMVFTDEEAQALVLGLLAARELGLAGIMPAIESAEAKLARVMPDPLRASSAGLRDTIALQVPAAVAADAQLLRELSRAAQARRCVMLRYRASDGSETVRGFDVYGLVFRAGRWYVVGHCQLRNGLRTLRMDRVTRLQAMQRSFERPHDFDAAAYLSEAMRSLPRAFPFEVRVTAELARVREHCFWMLGTLAVEGDGVRVRGSTDDLDWTARQLLGLPFDVDVIGPPSLKVALSTLVKRLALRHADPSPWRNASTLQATP
jgi:predicted DNA-binding transcriptional regulator YafY